MRVKRDGAVIGLYRLRGVNFEKMQITFSVKLAQKKNLKNLPSFKLGKDCHPSF
jgi:hypothetical protein